VLEEDLRRREGSNHRLPQCGGHADESVLLGGGLRRPELVLPLQ
jgi:hypothetical protein